MILNFNEIPVTSLKNFYGGEKELSAHMHRDEKNKILHGTLAPGATIGLHTHETSSEIIYFLEGTGKVIYDDGEENVQAGVCHYCPKGHSHSLINDGKENLVFFAVVPEQ
ncbi:MAG: cupin domain-containing protein [Clostridiales bacterium]|nr:cupin domain-containing protein [Clostridiales bacterium]